MSAPLAFDGTPVPRAVIVVRCAAVWRSVLRPDAGTHTNAIALCPHCVCPQGGKSSTGLGPHGRVERATRHRRVEKGSLPLMGDSGATVASVTCVVYSYGW